MERMQWSRYKTTVRYPNRAGQSQDARVAQVLSNENSSLRSNVALLLLSYTDFDAFSNNQWRSDQQQGSFGSLEDVHNEIHDKVGGNGGHMGALEVAAFDPIFWLHHCNVDRLLAIWQDLNPDSEMAPQPASTSTFTTEQGTTESAASALSPFWDHSGSATFWTPDRVKDSTTFGYAYPETQKWQFASGDAYQTALRQTVTGIYGRNVFRNFQQSLAAAQVSIPAAPPLAPAPAPVLPTAVFSKPVSHALLNTLVAEKKTAGQPIVQVTPLGSGETTPPVHDVHAHEPWEMQHPVVVQHAPNTEQPPQSQPQSQPQAQARKTNPPAIDVHGNDSDNKAIPTSLAHLAPNNRYNEWIVNIRALKHGLDQTFRVMVFLGPLSAPSSSSSPSSIDATTTSPEDWDLDPNCVGRVSILGQSEIHCSKCRSDKDNALVVSGTVPLTTALLAHVVAGRLASLEPADVVPYLRENLAWRVSVFSGEEKDAAQVPGLSVGVCSTQVAIGPDGMPSYSGVYVLHPEATTGRAGGVTAQE
jgi:tyrosinase